ncbi:protein SHI RELATED SEQUENCE 5-like [Typha latifolia]|uniref:protein SHI RELATED SEQUENCE 5-like n=1 Tax=Typha latifolia TaxID=4733 RepID=UPI003C2AD823
MGMVGLRDVLVVAPAASFHHTQHHHHHLHHHHHDSSSSSSSANLLSSSDHPLIPLLATAPCLVDPDNPKSIPGSSAASGIQFWQPQPHPGPPQQNPNPNPNPTATISYLGKPVPNLEGPGVLGGVSTCQDCGNQAKKDCIHRRCRTCCKSRGFECSTHVKSTWVPAARRRERQQIAAASASAVSTSAPKKPRLVPSQTTTSHTSTSNTTPPRSFDTSSSHHQQDASFRESLPRHVRAPAVFKCVRVTSIDDGEDEYAYQAMVTIGGHVFKGFLYDQGVDDGQTHDHDSVGTADTTVIPNISELHLGGGGRNGGATSSSQMLASSDVYGAGAPQGGGGFLGVTNFGNPIN